MNNGLVNLWMQKFKSKAGETWYLLGKSMAYESKMPDINFFAREIKPFWSFIYECPENKKQMLIKTIKTSSPKFGKCILIESFRHNCEQSQWKDVSCRRILIHKGNYLKDTSNCLIPIKKYQISMQDDVYNVICGEQSSIAFQEMMSYHEDTKTFLITLVD